MDTTAPVISLTGESELTVEAGDAFTDAGATSLDIVDGDLTGELVLVSTVDTSKPGEYTVTYSSSDTSDNKSEDVVRKVTVVDTTAPVISLVGLAEVSVTEGSTYNELGATANDIVDGDLSANIPSVEIR